MLNRLRPIAADEAPEATAPTVFNLKDWENTLDGGILVSFDPATAEGDPLQFALKTAKDWGYQVEDAPVYQDEKEGQVRYVFLVPDKLEALMRDLLTAVDPEAEDTVSQEAFEKYLSSLNYDANDPVNSAILAELSKRYQDATGKTLTLHASVEVAFGELRHWVAVSLDIDVQGNIVLVPCENEASADVLIEELNNASNVTVFAVDNYGEAKEEDARSYFMDQGSSRRTVVVVPESSTPQDIYKILRGRTSSVKVAWTDPFEYLGGDPIAYVFNMARQVAPQPLTAERLLEALQEDVHSQHGDEVPLDYAQDLLNRAKAHFASKKTASINPERGDTIQVVYQGAHERVLGRVAAIRPAEEFYLIELLDAEGSPNGELIQLHRERFIFPVPGVSVSSSKKTADWYSKKQLQKERGPWQYDLSKNEGSLASFLEANVIPVMAKQDPQETLQQLKQGIDAAVASHALSEKSAARIWQNANAVLMTKAKEGLWSYLTNVTLKGEALGLTPQRASIKTSSFDFWFNENKDGALYFDYKEYVHETEHMAPDAEIMSYEEWARRYYNSEEDKMELYSSFDEEIVAKLTQKAFDPSDNIKPMTWTVHHDEDPLSDEMTQEETPSGDDGKESKGEEGMIVVEVNPETKEVNVDFSDEEKESKEESEDDDTERPEKGKPSGLDEADEADNVTY